MNDEYPSYYTIGSGDLNDDGKQDLILSFPGLHPGGSEDGNTYANILLGNGDGTFQSPITLTVPTSGAAEGFTVEDVNLDARLDLIFNDGQLALGNGDGTFAFGTPLFTTPNDTSYPLVSMNLAGDPVASLVFLATLFTPPASSVFTPQTSSSAALSLSTLAVGQHTIIAQYSGDANYASSSSAGVTITVNQAASAIAVQPFCQPRLCRAECDAHRKRNQQRTVAHRQRDFHLRFDHSRHSLSERGIGCLHHLFQHRWRADNRCFLLR